ncbi:hypothetical protein C7S18_11390 [Ahniella affigens]|uniref:EfeO-type cupredoxin-like domain-containing protein n=2 Tax=Ahniella affigens TaxID=2021234 RepID=A0A2P1PZ40_9GAMM|nr:hypothetical protein C7S18_11390 [Ahniella affigens]
MRTFGFFPVAGLSLGLLTALPLHAEPPAFELRIKDHQFTPSELKIPAGVKVRLVVHNDDPTPEEFESHALNREKVIPGGSKAVIFIGPLKSGRYPFVGEIHEASAQGVLMVE